MSTAPLLFLPDVLGVAAMLDLTHGTKGVEIAQRLGRVILDHGSPELLATYRDLTASKLSASAARYLDAAWAEVAEQESAAA
jgi:hypothetical protein